MTLLYRSRILFHHVNGLFPPSYTLLPRRPFASRRDAAIAEDHPDDDVTAARSWLANLNTRTIPQHLCDVSFSRSGGPGGQHVNK